MVSIRWLGIFVIHLELSWWTRGGLAVPTHKPKDQALTRTFTVQLMRFSLLSSCMMMVL